MLAGARQAKTCEVLGVCLRTWQRWKSSKNTEDQRIHNNTVPANRLSELEVQRILKISNEGRFANLPPKKIVPMLADEGKYRGGPTLLDRFAAMLSSCCLGYAACFKS